MSTKNSRLMDVVAGCSIASIEVQCPGPSQSGLVVCDHAVFSSTFVTRHRRRIFEDSPQLHGAKLGQHGLGRGKTALERGFALVFCDLGPGLEKNARVLPTGLGEHGLSSGQFFEKSRWRSFECNRCQIHPDYGTVQPSEHGQFAVILCLYLLCS